MADSSNTASSLFDREPPRDYIEDWMREVAAARETAASDLLSLLVFRLQGEWLAFRTEVFREAIQTRPIHRVPHRSNDTFLGLTNVRGELRLCIALDRLLGIEPAPVEEHSLSRRVYARFAVVEKAGECWVFPVTEIYGTHLLPRREVAAAPVNVARSNSPFTSGVFRLRDRPVGVLDDELVLYKLRKQLL